MTSMPEEKWKEFMLASSTETFTSQDARQFLESSLYNYNPSTRVGGGFKQQMTRLGGRANFDGRQSYAELFTTSAVVDKGDVCVLDSNGKLQPTSVSGISSTETANTTTTPTSVPDEAKKFYTLSITGTVKLFVFVGADGSVYTIRTVVDPSDGSFTSIGTTTIDSGANLDSVNACRISDTTALVIYGDSGTTTLYARMLTGLGSGVTVGAEFTVSADAGNLAVDNAAGCARFSDSEAIIFFEENSSGDLYTERVTISGSTITGSTNTSVVTYGSNDLFAAEIERFGDTDYYALVYVENDGGTYRTKTAVGLYNAGAWTVGTAVESDNFTSENKQHAIGLSDRTLIIGYSEGTDPFAIAGRRVGTTISFGTRLDLGTTDSNTQVPLARLGKKTFAAGLNGDDCSLVTVEGTTLTLEEEVSFSTEVTLNVPVYFGPSFIMAFNIDGVAVDVRSRGLTNNYSQVVGIASRSSKANRGGGATLNDYTNDITQTLTVNTIYYAGIDGALVTAAEGGTVRVGIAISSTELNVSI